jgi:hypothetical protein
VENVSREESGLMEKSAIAVSESGIHIVVDGILTSKESLILIQDMRSALLEWATLTGKFIDSGKKRGKKK